jgi:hypothetical protein
MALCGSDQPLVHSISATNLSSGHLSDSKLQSATEGFRMFMVPAEPVWLPAAQERSVDQSKTGGCGISDR